MGLAENVRDPAVTFTFRGGMADFFATASRLSVASLPGQGSSWLSAWPVRQCVAPWIVEGKRAVLRAHMAVFNSVVVYTDPSVVVARHLWVQQGGDPISEHDHRAPVDRCSSSATPAQLDQARRACALLAPHVPQLQSCLSDAPSMFLVQVDFEPFGAALHVCDCSVGPPRSTAAAVGELTAKLARRLLQVAPASNWRARPRPEQGA